MKKTAIIGATPNPSRYAYHAAHMLVANGHLMVPIGIKKGNLAGIDILDMNTKPEIKGIHTITLYIGERNQEAWYDYLLNLNPERIIFNPGTENSKFEQLAASNGIEVIKGCTLVMLSVGNY